MRIDVVSIFPDYLAPLSLSLPGQGHGRRPARRARARPADWTHDRHRTVDDTPYGGGAGMVMKPEPWGEALDAVPREGDPPVVSWCRPRRGSRSPRRWPPSWRGRAAPALRLRPLRGHRPAGRRPRAHPGRGARGVDRRLRAQRRRGRGSRGDRGGRPAAAGRSWATPSRSPRSRTAAVGLLEYPVYTKPTSLARARRAGRAALRPPRTDRPVASRPGAPAYRRTSPRPARTPGRRRARRAGPERPRRFRGRLSAVADLTLASVASATAPPAWRRVGGPPATGGAPHGAEDGSPRSRDRFRGWPVAPTRRLT